EEEEERRVPITCQFGGALRRRVGPPRRPASGDPRSLRARGEGAPTRRALTDSCCMLPPPDRMPAAIAAPGVPWILCLCVFTTRTLVPKAWSPRSV
ncbi:unnamed protein product, partial [Prorocentrum cordatum]